MNDFPKALLESFFLHSALECVCLCETEYLLQSLHFTSLEVVWLSFYFSFFSSTAEDLLSLQ